MSIASKSIDDTDFAQKIFSTFESENPSMKDLIIFHRNNKFLLQSKDELIYRQLGRLAGKHVDMPFVERISLYKAMFLEAFSKKNDTKKGKNALEHMAGFIKKDINRAEKTLLHRQIEDYADEKTSVSLPLDTLRSYALKYDCRYLLEQTFLGKYLSHIRMKRILWFRRDLRAEDNPLLDFDGEIFPIFIFDPNILNSLKPCDRRVSYIFYFVCELKQRLKERGLDLKIFYGDPKEVFEYLDIDHFDEVSANVDFDEYARKRDMEISSLLHFKPMYDTYIFKPDEILKKDHTPYLVFTHFYKKAVGLLETKIKGDEYTPSQILYRTDYDGITHVKDKTALNTPLTIESVGFEEQNIMKEDPHKKLALLIDKLKDYKENRDRLDIDGTSSLSVDLRFGTISVREIIRRIKDLEGSEAFIRQLLFRDFYASMLFHFPYLETSNYKYRFNGIKDSRRFEAFCKGSTGVPIIDAGVRELLQTGRMHNRVRMITASFFTKDLLLPWQWGEKFFAEHLLDYDAASNILSWQWSAGTGIDPQPYFRIFNPYLQAERFDKKALYIKKWIPELASVPPKDIHSETYLAAHTIYNYPQPIVDHKKASKSAIDHFKSSK